MSDVRVARKPNVRIASPGTRTRGVVPKNSAVIFLPITALFYSPKKIKIASILASKYLSIIRKSKCSTDFKRNDFLKKNEAYPLGALRSLKFAYRKLRISLFVELAV